MFTVTKELQNLMVRKNGELVPVSWDEALDVIADRFSTIKAATWS